MFKWLICCKLTIYVGLFEASVYFSWLHWKLCSMLALIKETCFCVLQPLLLIIWIPLPTLVSDASGLFHSRHIQDNGLLIIRHIFLSNRKHICVESGCFPLLVMNQFRLDECVWPGLDSEWLTKLDHGAGRECVDASIFRITSVQLSTCETHKDWGQGCSGWILMHIYGPTDTSLCQYWPISACPRYVSIRVYQGSGLTPSRRPRDYRKCAWDGQRRLSGHLRDESPFLGGFFMCSIYVSVTIT